MRILCLSSFFREEGGGVAHMAHLLANELAHFDGIDVTLAAQVGNHTEPSHEVESYERMRLRGKNWFETMFGVPLLMPSMIDVRALLSAVRTCEILLVHDSVYLTNLLALLTARRAQRTILIKHTGRVKFTNSFGRAAFTLFKNSIEKAALRKCDIICFVTSQKRKEYPEISDNFVRIIPNGIDKSIFYPRDIQRDKFLLFVGRFVEKKGIHVIKNLAKLSPDTQFVLAGYGAEDPDLWKLPNVKCFWRPSPLRLAGLYSTCRATILPGQTEGTPLVALEALACESPVVISDWGLADDCALNRQMSFLEADLSDPKGTARYWNDALDTAISSSKPNASVIEGKYSGSVMAERYLEVIDDLTAHN